ncbi:hypothetical protein ACAG39_08255 [Caldicellulosiruptoraceae bacterium PP1]
MEENCIDLFMGIFKNEPSLIKLYLEYALELLFIYDKHLIVENLHERTIAHRLAIYLETLFGFCFNVDCEYNGNKDHATGRKKIWVIEDLKRKAFDKLKCLMMYHQNLKEEVLEFLQEVNVYPDIIIHKRGNNNYNLLVIEIKKMNSDYDDIIYDYYKLQQFTNQNGEFQYAYGVFIEFYTGRKAYKKPLLKWFKDGKEDDELNKENI